MDRQFVSISPEILGGTPVFAGTRVPVQVLIEYLSAGESIDDFLAGFPSVSREQVLGFLQVRQALETGLAQADAGIGKSVEEIRSKYRLAE